MTHPGPIIVVVDGPRLFDHEKDLSADPSSTPGGSGWHPSHGVTSAYQERLRAASDRLREVSPVEKRADLARRAAERSRSRRHHVDSTVRAAQKHRRTLLSLAAG